MNVYYYELDNGNGHMPFPNDEYAVWWLKKSFGLTLIVVYKENETADGTPFIILYERDK